MSPSPVDLPKSVEDVAVEDPADLVELPGERLWHLRLPRSRRGC